MAAEAVLRLLDTSAARVAWWLPGGRAGRGSLAEAGEALAAAGQRSPVVLVPGEQVRQTAVTVPAQSERQRRQALPYALEPQLASPLADLTLAAGASDAGGQTPVLAVAQARLGTWRQAWSRYGLRPRRIVPDSLALPAVEGGWHLLLEPGGARVLLRCDAAHGYALEPALVTDLARAWADAGAAPARLVVAATADEQADARRLAEQVAEAMGLAEASLDPRHLPPSPAGDAATGYLAQAAGWPADRDLLAAGRGGRRVATALKHWRAPLALATACLAVLAINAGLSLYGLHQEVAHHRAVAQERFAQLFPDAPALTHPQAQISDRVAQLRRRSELGGDGFVGLVRRAGPALVDSEVALQRLAYRDGDVTLELTAPGLPALEALAAELDGRSRLSATLADTVIDGQQARAQLTLRPVEAS